MKLKFRSYSRITFIFSWLNYEEILKTLESQVGWLLQKMALKAKSCRTHIVYGMGQELLFWKLKNLNKLLVFEALYP